MPTTERRYPPPGDSERRAAVWAIRVMLFVAGAVALTGCGTVSFTRAPPPAETNTHAAFDAAWTAYIDAVEITERTPDCRPRRLEVDTSVERRGAVVMIHGFGGCPQQFFDLATRVRARGFDVLLPLLPGHGIPPPRDGEDDLSALPADEDQTSHYAELATALNRIMAASPGKRVMVGFSLGGAVGLNAVLQAPELYDRLLLLGPLLAVRGGTIVEGLAEGLGRTPGLRDLVVKPRGAREACRAWQAQGRAGFCDYRYKHVVALIDLVQINRGLYAQQPPMRPTQIVAAGDEDYVSNSRIAEYAQQQRAYGAVSLCYMPDDVPHEMLSPYENQGRDMYWLDGLLAGATRFIVAGKNFPQAVAGESDDRPACMLQATDGATN
jgi:pimeloyl-ACP methyl ester carboxylesterase